MDCQNISCAWFECLCFVCLWTLSWLLSKCIAMVLDCLGLRLGMLGCFWGAGRSISSHRGDKIYYLNIFEYVWRGRRPGQLIFEVFIIYWNSSARRPKTTQSMFQHRFKMNQYRSRVLQRDQIWSSMSSRMVQERFKEDPKNRQEVQ